MKHTHIGGVDPGLVHTGVVGMEFDALRRRIIVKHTVVSGASPENAATEAAAWLHSQHIPASHTWVEQYRDRGNLGSNARMHSAVRLMRFATGGHILDNTGIKKVVTDDLMKLLGVWSFSTPTHHQDLRSAARIALLGHIKTDDGNEIIAGVVRDHLTGRTWHVE